MLKGSTQEEATLVLNNGCSRHMISDESLFQELDKKKVGMFPLVTTPKVLSKELELLVTILILKLKMWFLDRKSVV